MNHLVKIAVLFWGAATLTAPDQLPGLIHYQGRLINGTNLMNGSMELSLRLFDALVGGSLLYEDSNTVVVVDGLYATVLGDQTIFGSLSTALTSTNLHLEVAVNGTPLSPRERVASVAYALRAEQSQTVADGAITSNKIAVGAVQLGHMATGSVGSAQLAPQSVTAVHLASNSVTSDRIVDYTITASDVASNTFWQTAGNAGTAPGAYFVGTTDNQPLDMRVNNARGLRLEPGATPNVVGGHSDNTVGVGRIGVFIGGGRTQTAGNDFVMIGGGMSNSAAGYGSAIGGGVLNTIQADSQYAMLGGGWSNNIRDYAYYAVLGGGWQNTIQAFAPFTTLGGGLWNTIQAHAQLATLGGGRQNTIGTNAVGATLSGGQNNRVGAGATNAVIGGGADNRVEAQNATLGGGLQNTIQSNAWYVTLGGGWSNKIQAYATYATLGGGYQNTIEAYAEYVTLGGGQENTIQTYAHYATLGGGWLNAIQTNASSATIGGGGENTIQTNAPFATIPGGRNNTVGAGATNAFAAGRRAKANHRGAFVWADSTDADFASTTANQFCVRAAGGVKIDTGNGPSIMLNGADRAMITRSFDTFNSGVHYPAGRWGVFMEPSKLVMGMPAIGGKEVHIAKYNADSTYTSLVWVTQSGDLYTLGAVNPPSDRAMKTDFAGVDGREIAAKVAALQIHSWRYAHDEGAARHLGPTAQDFRAAFGLGGSDRHIATVDADGVALAAIQGLYTLVREKEDEITELKGRLAELEARINRLVTH